MHEMKYRLAILSDYVVISCGYVFLKHRAQSDLFVILKNRARGGVGGLRL